MIVRVQTGKYGKVCCFDAGDMPLRGGDPVIVESEIGEAFGVVLCEPQSPAAEMAQRPMRKVLRVASGGEAEKHRRNSELENHIFDFCLAKIKERSLPMCLVSVQCLFDTTKAIVYFTADGRVDFRELVKDLVHRFRMRIEMKQIGVRHQAKMVGGLGTCGRHLCCASFLGDFAPVSIKMAKEQNLSLNPAKISGMCGRLMCCLNYEFDYYEKARKDLPKVGKKVNTVYGTGKVIRQNILTERMTITLESGEEKEISFDDIIREPAPQKTSSS